MDVFDAVSTVLAVRSYQDKPVPETTIARIVEAGRLSASGGNAQPWYFIVVENKDTLRKLATAVRTGPYVAQAAFAIVVVIHRTPSAVSDGSRAIQSMILTAWSEGVGSNWTGFGAIPAVNQLLAVPDDLDVLAVLPFGYAAQERVKGKKNRKPADEVIFQEKFGQHKKHG